MKSLVIGLLAFGSITAFAQAQNTFTVTVDVGGCINTKYISYHEIHGNEWELRAIPLDRLEREVEDRIKIERYDAAVKKFFNVKVGYDVFKGPMLGSTITIKSDQKLRIEIWEKDTGIYYLAGGNNGYTIAEIDSKLVSKKKPLVLGKATSEYPSTNDCLRIEKK